MAVFLGFKDQVGQVPCNLFLVISHLNMQVKHPQPFLPIIDLMPKNMNCILSTFKFVSNLAYSLGQPTITTFDQPLFWKASKIIQNATKPAIKKITVTLGLFHSYELAWGHWNYHGKHWLK